MVSGVGVGDIEQNEDLGCCLVGGLFCIGCGEDWAPVDGEERGSWFCLHWGLQIVKREKDHVHDGLNSDTMGNGGVFCLEVSVGFCLGQMRNVIR